MTKVWIVVETTSHPEYTMDGPGFYDTTCITGVFSTKEKADKYMKIQKAKFNTQSVWSPQYKTEEHEVD